MRTVRRRLWPALAAALSVPLAAAAMTGVPAEAGTHVATAAPHAHHGGHSARVTFASTKASWATPAAKSSTALRGRSTMTFRVALKLRHQKQAEKSALRASTPGNKSYGHYLKAQQFQSRYGASTQTVGRLSAYFRAQGMHVVSSDWHAISLRATVGSVEKTFDTSLSLYRVGGQQLRAADRALSLPRAYGKSVETVSGVTQSGTVRMPMTARPAEPTATSTATPVSGPAPQCSAYWNQNQYTLPPAYGRTSFPTYLCGYTPAQLRAGYGIASLRNNQGGAGTKVAIIDAYGSPTILKDANTYAARRGDAPFTKGQYQQKLFKPFANQEECGGEEGWNGEQTLDVEAVHGIAPSAQVLYVGGQDCITGLDQAQQWIVDNATNPNSPAYGVSIVSNSYGFPGDEPNVIVDPAEQAGNHQTLIQAANEGIGFYFSSGDEGDNVIYGYSTRPQASYESSDPFATGVGGTSLALDSVGNYLFETGWGSAADPVTTDTTGKPTGYQLTLPGAFRFGGGGGVSTQFAQPYYQVGTVPDSLSQLFGSTKMRVAPDVAMVGDPYTGFLIGETVDGVYSESDIGGTSLAAPLFAGVQAVTQGTGAHIGFANPLLYALKSTAFRDIVPPAQIQAVAGPRSPTTGGQSLITFDRDSSLTTAGGYDDVTGRGTPNGSTFVKQEQKKLQ